MFILFKEKKKKIWENLNCDEYSNLMDMITVYSLYLMSK